MAGFRPLAIDTTTIPGPSAVREPIEPHTAWQRPTPLFYLDLSPVPRPTTVFEANRERHAVAWVELGPRLVYGSHHFLALLDPVQPCLTLPETDDDRARFRIAHHLDNPPPGTARLPLIRRAGGGFEVQIAPEIAKTVLAGPVFAATPTEPGNWGVWLLEGLPNAHEFVRRGQKGSFLCWQHAPWQAGLLRFMGVDPARVVNQVPWRVYQCNDVALRQVSRANLVPTPSDVALFQDIAARCGRAPGPERIFLGRRHLPQNATRRRLADEAALAAGLERMGFVDAQPDALPFEDQVRLFAGARVVVGLGGAALFNTVFCRPGTTVVSLEGGPYFTDDHASLFAGLGHQYGFILGERAADDLDHAHGTWRLDVARALQAIGVFC